MDLVVRILHGVLGGLAVPIRLGQVTVVVQLIPIGAVMVLAVLHVEGALSRGHVMERAGQKRGPVRGRQGQKRERVATVRG